MNAKTEYTEGDLIEVKKGETRLRGHVTRATDGVVSLNIGTEEPLSIAYFTRRGYSVEVIKKAPQLEPGVYLPGPYYVGRDRLPNLWVFQKGQWWNIGNTWNAAPTPLKFDSRDAEQVVRLEPASVTARKVFERIYERYGEDYFHNRSPKWNEVAREFGVSA